MEVEEIEIQGRRGIQNTKGIGLFFVRFAFLRPSRLLMFCSESKIFSPDEWSSTQVDYVFYSPVMKLRMESIRFRVSPVDGKRDQDRFINRAEFPIDIKWLDHNGTLHYFTRLGQDHGANAEVVGQTWLVSDNNGTPLFILYSGGRDSRRSLCERTLYQGLAGVGSPSISGLAYPAQGMGGVVKSAVAENLGGKLFHVSDEPVNRLQDPVLRQFLGRKGNAHPLEGMSGGADQMARGSRAGRAVKSGDREGSVFLLVLLAYTYVLVQIFLRILPGSRQFAFLIQVFSDRISNAIKAVWSSSVSLLGSRWMRQAHGCPRCCISFRNPPAIFHRREHRWPKLLESAVFLVFAKALWQISVCRQR